MILSSQGIQRSQSAARLGVLLALKCGLAGCGGGGGESAVLTITQPVTTAYANGLLQVQVEVQGAPDPARVDLLLDGDLFTILPAPYRYALDTRALAERPHTLNARATFDGRIVISAPRTVNVDRTPPRVRSHEPAAGDDNVLASAPVHLTFNEPVLPSALQDGIQLSSGTALPYRLELSPDQTDLLIFLTDVAAPRELQASVVVTDLAGNRSAPLVWSWSAPAWFRKLAIDVVPPNRVQASALAIDQWGSVWTLTAETQGGLVLRQLDAEPDLVFQRPLPLPDAGVGVTLSIGADLVLLMDPFYSPWDYGGEGPFIGTRLLGHDPAGTLVYDSYYVELLGRDEPLLFAPGPYALRMFPGPDGGPEIGAVSLPGVNGPASSLTQVWDLDGRVIAGSPGEVGGAPGVVEYPGHAGLSVDGAQQYQVWSFDWDGVASSARLWKWTGAGWAPTASGGGHACASQQVRAWYDVAAGEPRLLCQADASTLTVLRANGNAVEALSPMPLSATASRPVGLTHDGYGKPVVLVTGTVSRLFRLEEEGWEQYGSDLDAAFSGDEVERGENQKVACRQDSWECDVLLVRDAPDGGQTLSVLTPNH